MSSKPGEGGARSIDDYVRFAFEAPAGTAGTGTVAIEDGDLALVEIAVDLATGRLRGATLVSFARRARDLPFALAAMPGEAALPVLVARDFDAGEYLPRVTRRGAVDLWRGAGIGLVQIADGVPDRLCRAGDAVFLAVGDRLWGFGADGLTDAEMSRMTG